MVYIGNLLNEIEERTIAQQVGIRHDETRVRYHLSSNTVANFDEFDRIISDYCNTHFTSCVTGGGRLSHAEAASRAKEIIEREYRRQGGDIVTAYNDAHDGTNGGLRSVLDMIAEGIKAESVERYIRGVFDRHVKPNSWEGKVDIIRQFIAHCGPFLSSSIRRDQPERYAQNYEELIRAYVGGLRQTSNMFRRL